MKILVLSDSHGELRHMCAAIARERPDFLIHLGDHERDVDRLQQLEPALAMCGVPGNCDYAFAGSNPNHVAEYDGVRVFMTHGHVFGVKSSLLRAELAAREAGASVLAFGHTHQALCEEKNGLWLLNPGSCMGGAVPSYGIILVENGNCVCYTETNLSK